MSAGAEVPGPSLLSAEGADTSEGYPPPLVDLTVIKEALRRTRKFWALMAVIGIVGGASLPFVIPAKYTATADLYMTEPAGADPVQAMDNDVSLLGTRAVAQRAVSALHLKVSAATFLTTYSGTAVSDVILQLKISAATKPEAVLYGNTLAKEFLALRAQELSYQTNLVVNDINAQVNALNGDIKELTTSIDALSAGAPGQQASDQLTTLVNERSNDSAQISSLQGESRQDLITENDVIQGSQVLDPAVLTKSSLKKTLVEDAMAGFVALLGIALGAVVVLAAVSDKPRRRSEIAALLAVPVELSVGRYRPGRWLRARRARRRLARPGPDLRAAVVRLRGQLDRLRDPALAVVTLEAADFAALSVAALAAALAAEGKAVVVVDMVDGLPLAKLFRAAGQRGRGTARTVAWRGHNLTLIAAPEDPSAFLNNPALVHADAMLVLAAVSPELGADHLAPWATNAVVVLSAGQASATRVASCGQLLRQAGVAPRSAVLVGAGPGDETVGAASVELAIPQRPAHARKGEEELAAPNGGAPRENGERAAGPVTATQP